MKRAVSFILLALVPAFIFCGCGTDTAAYDNDRDGLAEDYADDRYDADDADNGVVTDDHAENGFVTDDDDNRLQDNGNGNGNDIERDDNNQNNDESAAARDRNMFR